MSDIDDIIKKGQAEKQQQHADAMEAQRSAPAQAQALTNKVYAEIFAALKSTLPVEPGPITDMSQNASVKSFGMQTQSGFGVQFRIKTAYQPGAQPEITGRAYYNGKKEELKVTYRADGDYSALVKQVESVAARLSRM